MTNVALNLMMEAAGDTYIDTVSVLEDGNLVLPPGSPNHFGNHSCDPALWWVDPFSLVARTAIAAGTELTVDYGPSRTIRTSGWSAGAVRPVVVA